MSIVGAALCILALVLHRSNTCGNKLFSYMQLGDSCGVFLAKKTSIYINLFRKDYFASLVAREVVMCCGKAYGPSCHEEGFTGSNAASRV